MHIKKELLRFTNGWSESNMQTFAAAVAYYTVFSIAPLLLIAISIAGLMVDQSQIEGQVLEQFRSVFGDGGVVFIQSLLRSEVTTNSNIVFIVVGLCVTLLGATGVFSGLQLGLDSIFRTLPKKEKEGGFWSIVMQKIYSLGMVLSLGFVLVVSLLVSALLAAFSHIINRSLPEGVLLSAVLEFCISYTLIALFLGCVLKILPSERLQWKPALKGGLVAGALFILGKYALALYLAHSTFASAYGAASSVVLLILWTYYLSLTFFMSAMVTRLYFIPKQSLH